MSQMNINQKMNSEANQDGWKGLYQLAGIATIIVVVMMLLDIGLSFVGGDAPVGEMSAVDWFAYIQKDWFLGMRNLGLFNVINTTLAIPLYLAMYRLHRKSAPAFALLALALCVFSAAVYTSKNQALSLLTLSNQYAAAATEAQRSLLASAGAVLLAQAEDFTPGTFLGFFFSSTSSLVLMIVMLRGQVFRKRLALTGLAGTTLLLLFTISVTFIPDTFDLAMIVALVGGLLMLAWDILVALAMFRLARTSTPDRITVSSLAEAR